MNKVVTITVAVLMLWIVQSVNAATCTSVSYTSVRNNTITYNFGDYQGLGSSYECGQYANSDWWVVAKGSPKAVHMTSMTPSFSNGQHGYDVNPGKDQQHLDINTTKYQGAPQSLPRTFTTNGQILSIVKAMSAQTGGTGQYGYKCDYDSSRSCIQLITVLTVVEQAPTNPADMFRPAYVGANSKKVFRVSDMDLSLVGQYRANCCGGRDLITSFQHVANRYRWPQSEQVSTWSATEGIHARDNFNTCFNTGPYPNSYGGCILSTNGTAALRFMLDDFDINNPVHKQALVGYVQGGIDLWAATEVGIGWNTTRSGQSGPTPFLGGVFNGRKIPVTFAAGMLGDPDLIAGSQATFYSENDQIYFSTTANRALWGEPGTQQGYLDGIRQNCGGNAPTGSNFRTGSQNPSVRDPQGWIDGSICTNHDYQDCCISMPFAYTALAVRMMGIESVFKLDILYDYAKRWRDHGKWTQPDGWSGRPFSSASYHGTQKAGGGYTTLFGEQMWSSFGAMPPKGTVVTSTTMEAEDMTMNLYIDDLDPRLTGSIIMVDPAAPQPATGMATGTFTGGTGTYTVKVTVLPEHDGQPSIKVYVGSNTIINQTFPTDPSYFDMQARHEFTATGVTVTNGDVIKIEGTSEGAAFARVDKIVFEPEGQTKLEVGKNHLTQQMLQFSPNPMSKYITFTIGKDVKPADVELFIYDNAGNVVKNIPGMIQWDGTDKEGKNVKAGVYLYRITGATFTASGKLMKID